MARPGNQADKQADKQREKDEENSGSEETQAEGRASSTQSAEGPDGYRPTRRHVARGGQSSDPKGSGKAAPTKKGPPPSKYRQFMDQHWESWLSQVLLIAVLAIGVIGYKLDYLREGMVGLLLAGGLIAVAIYGTAGPAYDLITNKRGRTCFALLTLVWAAAVGYPALRKAVPRKVLAETVLTEQNKSVKLPIGENVTGPFDITVSGSIKPEAGSERKIDYTLLVTGDNNANTELLGQFEVRVNQMRTRRGSSHWTQQHNQVEHRLPRNLRGHELQLATEQVDDSLQSGLHVAVHPQSLNPLWFLIAGILVVLCMIYVEAKIGDAKTKTHLIMASATTLIFSWHFSENATASRLVAPALDSLFLALLTGGIGGTIVGAVVRRVSGRDRLKPKGSSDDQDDGKNKD